VDAAAAAIAVAASTVAAVSLAHLPAPVLAPPPVLEHHPDSEKIDAQAAPASLAQANSPNSEMLTPEADKATAPVVVVVLGHSQYQ